MRRGVFRDDEVNVVRAALDRLYAMAQTLRATGDHEGAFFALTVPPEGLVVVQRVVWAGGAEPEWHARGTLDAEKPEVGAAGALMRRQASTS